jgi:1-acyl-sn-glycerol-3-phosphate acyltransferase
MSIFDVSTTPYEGEDLQRYIKKALAVTHPEGLSQKLMYAAIKRMFGPQLFDTDNIPDQPCLYVANHSLFAMDASVLIPTMLAELGVFLRSMGDKFLWSSATEDFLLELGVLLGHPEVCGAMMESGADLLVFPGGAHESVKSADKRYQLQWKERYGFVKLAARYGYTIMPVAIVGPDEFYNHIIEGEDLPDSVVGGILKRAGVLTENTRTDVLMPVPSGLLGTLLPKPQRCYFKFGQPIDLSELKGKQLSQNRQEKVRGQVAGQIEKMLAELLLQREQKRGDDSVLRRLLTL